MTLRNAAVAVDFHGEAICSVSNRCCAACSRGRPNHPFPLVPIECLTPPLPFLRAEGAACSAPLRNGQGEGLNAAVAQARWSLDVLPPVQQLIVK